MARSHRCGIENRDVRSHVSTGEDSVISILSRLWRDEEGQDLTEYALLVVFLVLVCIASVQTLGSVISDMFSNAAASLT
jgi:Flp pilus assembly pilin Flp